MIKNRGLYQYNFDNNLNGYTQWSRGTFYSFDSGNLIAVYCYYHDNELRYLI